MGELIMVGSADEVADHEMKVFPVGLNRIVIARLNGQLYAFDDECTHAACSLGDGELEEATVVCPCHMGQFDLTTGEVIDGPPPVRIKVYPVQEIDGKLAVDL